MSAKPLALAFIVIAYTVVMQLVLRSADWQLSGATLLCAWLGGLSLFLLGLSVLIWVISVLFVALFGRGAYIVLMLMLFPVQPGDSK